MHEPRANLKFPSSTGNNCLAYTMSTSALTAAPAPPALTPRNNLPVEVLVLSGERHARSGIPFIKFFVRAAPHGGLHPSITHTHTPARAGARARRDAHARPSPAPQDDVGEFIAANKTSIEVVIEALQLMYSKCVRGAAHAARAPADSRRSHALSPRPPHRYK